jgi:hypothetical protein
MVQPGARAVWRAPAKRGPGLQGWPDFSLGVHQHPVFGTHWRSLQCYTRMRMLTICGGRADAAQIAQIWAAEITAKPGTGLAVSRLLLGGRGHTDDPALGTIAGPAATRVIRIVLHLGHGRRDCARG